MKKVIAFLLAAALLVALSGCNNLKKEADTSNSVYASYGEQDTIYAIIQKSNDFMAQLNYDGITVLKESITPIYTARIVEYAETGVFTIKREIVGNTSDNGNAYIVKTVTADGLFAGNMRFYIENGVAHTQGFTPSSLLEHYFDPDYGFGENEFLVSRSYADHARRIQNLMNSDTFIAVTNVRYVIVEILGEVFYINDGKTEALVVISADANVFNEGSGEIVYFGDELKKIADEKLTEYNEFMTLLEQWKDTNPAIDSSPPFDNPMKFGLHTVRNLRTDDISNIREYLNMDK